MKTVLALARRGVTYELAAYRSLFRWVTRRPDIPSDAVPVPYFGAIAVLVWAFIVVSAIELVALHLILPWEIVRLIVDIVSIWGLVWMFGFMASFKVHPHLVSDSGIRVRNGALTDITVPWDAVARVGVRERSRDKSHAIQLDQDDQRTVLNVVMGSRTNVELTLRRPLVVPLRKGDESVTEIRMYADDARGLAKRAREHLAPRDSKNQAVR